MPCTAAQHARALRCFAHRAVNVPRAAAGSSSGAPACASQRYSPSFALSAAPSRHTHRCSTLRAPPLRAAGKDDSSGAEEAELIDMDAEDKMEKTLDSVRRNFGTVRTGRANVSILDRIQVDYYGTMTPLKKVANASTPDAQTITIQPFDKTAIKDIERAINTSDLGITPSNDGNIIRLNVPPLTQERRKELTKQVGKLTEEGKVALRNVRRDALKALEKLEKDKLLSEDQLTAAKESLQKKIDAFVKQVDDLGDAKNKELMQV